jgi:VanZ family protein
MALWIATGLYWVALFVLTHTPALPPPPGGISDKGAHVLAYGALAGALFLTLWVNRPGMSGLGWKVLAVCTAYGAADEWLQALPMVGRSCEIRDWVADVLGAGIAVGVLGLLRRAVARRPVEAKMAA